MGCLLKKTNVSAYAVLARLGSDCDSRKCSASESLACCLICNRKVRSGPLRTINSQTKPTFRLLFFGSIFDFVLLNLVVVDWGVRIDAQELPSSSYIKCSFITARNSKRNVFCFLKVEVNSKKFPSSFFFFPT